jgi:hypothetical protein
MEKINLLKAGKQTGLQTVGERHMPKNWQQ